mmetsp:Transcript_7446/g.8441  ORF Transcript_7446/g.8441 Transcript_7446/m.8441 type:complete len:125 (-) Transcript_7446:23-397(-)
MNDLQTDQDQKLLNNHQENVRYLDIKDTSINQKFDEKLKESQNLIFNQDLHSGIDKSWEMNLESKDGSYIKVTSFIEKDNVVSRGISKPKNVVRENLTSFEFDSNTGENSQKNFKNLDDEFERL